MKNGTGKSSEFDILYERKIKTKNLKNKRAAIGGLVLEIFSKSTISTNLNTVYRHAGQLGSGMRALAPLDVGQGLGCGKGDLRTNFGPP